SELNQFTGREVMNEEHRADGIEAPVAKGKRQSIAGHRTGRRTQVSVGTVHEGELYMHAVSLQGAGRELRGMAGPGSHFEQAEGAHAIAGYPLEHVAGNADAAEPAVDALQV